jgi:hypothetical protein
MGAANPRVPSRTRKETEEEITSEGAGDRERLFDPYQRKQHRSDNKCFILVLDTKQMAMQYGGRQNKQQNKQQPW